MWHMIWMSGPVIQEADAWLHFVPDILQALDWWRIYFLVFHLSSGFFCRFHIFYPTPFQYMYSFDVSSTFESLTESDCNEWKDLILDLRDAIWLDWVVQPLTYFVSFLSCGCFHLTVVSIVNFQGKVISYRTRRPPNHIHSKPQGFLVEPEHDFLVCILRK